MTADRGVLKIKPEALGQDVVEPNEDVDGCTGHGTERVFIEEEKAETPTCNEFRGAGNVNPHLAKETGGCGFRWIFQAFLCILLCGAFFNCGRPKAGAKGWFECLQSATLSSRNDDV